MQRAPARGARPQYDHRLVIDTILYVLVSGCRSHAPALTRNGM